MKEILFRAWHYGSMWMYDVLNIDLEHGTVALKYEEYTPVVAKSDVVLEQYTGLLDKNGKKIFEGDRVEVEGRKYTVAFDEKRGGWFPFATGDGCGCCESETETPNRCEIIGNIHEVAK